MVAGLVGVRTGVVGFILGHWVHWGAPLVSSGSFGVTGFTGVLPGGRRVHPASLGSLVCALGFAGFIKGHWVNWGVPWGTSGSSGVIVVAGDPRVHPGSLGSLGCPLGCRRVLPRSLGTLVCALVVVGFIRGRWVHLMHPGVHLGSLRCALGFLDSSRVAGFIGVGQGDVACVVVFVGCTLGSSCSTGVNMYIRLRHGGRRVHPG